MPFYWSLVCAAYPIIISILYRGRIQVEMDGTRVCIKCGRRILVAGAAVIIRGRG